MRFRDQRPWALGAIVAVAFIASCGGSSPTAPPATPAPPAGPVTFIMGQGSDPSLELGWSYWVPFNTHTAGRLDATVDWGSSTGDIVVRLATGRHTCTEGIYWNFNVCDLIVTIDDASKPKTFSIADLPAGSYTLYIVNLGTKAESISWKVTLTTPG